ncbi:hypothetical protein CEXT_246931 [Caerostris extrusa]|uniref:Uncharacterized protein n=1 Tax=Caerostris extrusa TaxID=172846 RepID=A0AAV4UYM7_CAEEX|nr:hypothetical protein CEXT_246931 [Caerostris extrusa]
MTYLVAAFCSKRVATTNPTERGWLFPYFPEAVVKSIGFLLQMKPFAPDQTHQQRGHPQKLLMKLLAVINNTRGAMTDPLDVCGRVKENQKMRMDNNKKEETIRRPRIYLGWNVPEESAVCQGLFAFADAVIGRRFPLEE